MTVYNPPITLTLKILNLVAEVSERLGRYAERTHRAQALRLRRANCIRTIQGSLAIKERLVSGLVATLLHRIHLVEAWG